MPYYLVFYSLDDEFISKVANTVEEACALVEAGYEYVCDIEDAKLFKKRK